VFISLDWFLPAYKAGGPIQSIANMVGQYTENISYKIFCSNKDLDGTVLNVPVNQWVRYNDITSVYYNSDTKRPGTLVESEVRKADILFINGIYSLQYNFIPLLFYKAPRKIVSARGMLHPGALSQKKIKKQAYLFLWKLLSLHKRCDFHASNEEEKKYIHQAFGKNVTVFVAQNFPRIFAAQYPSAKKKGSLKLISIALISPMKNHLLILKALMNCTGNISYDIYGPVKDQEYWDACQQQIKQLPGNINVAYHGDVPSTDIEKKLATAEVFILPSKSENFGHAIFEALTAGKPVITSDKTPWNDLRVHKAGINVEQESLNDLAGAIDFFTAMDSVEFSQWSTNAHTYAVNAINIDEIKAQYREMFRV
jgi:glycosyltransferase involved in cell wall biosynthesis